MNQPDLERLVGGERLGALRQERRPVDGDDDGPARVGVDADESVDLSRRLRTPRASRAGPRPRAARPGRRGRRGRPTCRSPARWPASRGGSSRRGGSGSPRRPWGRSSERCRTRRRREPSSRGAPPRAAPRAAGRIACRRRDGRTRGRAYRVPPPRSLSVPSRPSRTAPSRSAASAADIATASVPWPGKEVSPTMWSPFAPSVGSRARRPNVAVRHPDAPDAPAAPSRVALERPRRPEVLVRDRRGQARHLALERLAQEEARLLLLPPVLLAPQRRPRGRFDVRRDRERLASRRRDGVARRREGEEERRPVAGAPVEPRRDEAVQAARDRRSRRARGRGSGRGRPTRRRAARSRSSALVRGELPGSRSRATSRTGRFGRTVRAVNSSPDAVFTIHPADGRGEARDESPGADLASGAHDGGGERLGERAHPAAGARDAPAEEVDAEGAVPPGGDGSGGLDADEEGEVEEGAERRVRGRALPFEDVGDGPAERREERQEARREEAEVADGVARGEEREDRPAPARLPEEGRVPAKAAEERGCAGKEPRRRTPPRPRRSRP